MRKGPENVVIIENANALKRTKVGIWKRVAELLLKPSRLRRGVNLSKLEAYVAEGGFAAVPDKVLGSGKLNKKLNVAAISFSSTARKGIEAKGGKCLTLKQLAEANPKGTGVIILR